MDLGLKGKVAIVTGCVGGIGASVVEAFVKEGENLVIADINLEAAQELAGKVRNDNTRVLAVKTDVSIESDAQNLASTAMKEFGKIDILVNNAGIIEGGKIVELEENSWNREMNVNAKGPYLVTKAVAPHMIAAGYGKIVNIASLAGKSATAGFGSYAASKFAVMGLTQAMAKELAQYNINVNAVCPGLVRTPMWEKILDVISKKEGTPREEIWESVVAGVELKRPQEPIDIANVILFLSSDVSKNMTGEAVSVNGGVRMD